jgi:hypothetical protein
LVVDGATEHSLSAAKQDVCIGFVVDEVLLHLIVTGGAEIGVKVLGVTALRRTFGPRGRRRRKGHSHRE